MVNSNRDRPLKDVEDILAEILTEVIALRIVTDEADPELLLKRSRQLKWRGIKLVDVDYEFLKVEPQVINYEQQ